MYYFVARPSVQKRGRTKSVKAGKSRKNSARDFWDYYGDAE